MNHRLKHKHTTRCSLALGLSLLSVVIGLAGNAAAEDPHASGDHNGPRHRHVAGVFFGATQEHGEWLETVGLEYGYRIHQLVSVGLLVEHAVRKDNSTLVLAVAHLHPYRGILLGVGAGRKNPDDNYHTTGRVSLGYEFEFHGGWTLIPQVALDVIEHEGEEEVFGLTVGKFF
jgi:hypothetical protein